MAIRKILYRFEHDDYNTPELVSDYTNLFIEKCYPKSSCWWTNLKSKINDIDITSLIKSNHIKQLNNQPIQEIENTSTYTAKVCPAIVSILKNAYLVKAPCDMIITVTPNGDIVAEIKNTNLINLESHSTKQFYETSNHFKDYINLKFKMPIYIKSDVSYCYLQPSYHNLYDMNVLCGVIEKPYTSLEKLNINVLVKKDSTTKQYLIKYGDVLAYLLPFEKVKLEHNKKRFFNEHTSLNFDQNGRFKLWNRFQ